MFNKDSNVDIKEIKFEFESCICTYRLVYPFIIHLMFTQDIKTYNEENKENKEFIIILFNL